MNINGLDIETTGFSHKRGDKIVQFCSIELLKDEEKIIGNIILNPLRNIPQEASNVHGISNNDIKDKPVFKDYSETIFNVLKNNINVGHNIRQFDLPFILQELYEADYDLNNFIGIKFIDTLSVARKVINSKKYDLDTLCNYFDITDKKRNLHDAEEDVELTLKVFFALKEITDINEFMEIIDQEYLDKHLINNRNNKVIPKYVSENNNDVLLLKKILNEKNPNLKLVRKTPFILENIIEDTKKQYISIWNYSKKHYIYSQLILDILITKEILDDNYYPTKQAILNKQVQFSHLANFNFPDLAAFVILETTLKEIIQNSDIYKNFKIETLNIAKNKYEPQPLLTKNQNNSPEINKITSHSNNHWLYT